jgi:agmatinase
MGVFSLVTDRTAAHDQISPGTVAILGLPWDEHSSFMQGASLAPTRIREALRSGSANMCAEDEQDLSANSRLRDLGDLDLVSDSSAVQQIEQAVADLLQREGQVLALGGDHAVTYPIVKAYAGYYDRLNLLHLDAHPDLYDVYDGDPLSHACPFARIMEQSLAVRLVQVGVRTINPHQREQAERFGVEVITMQDWDSTFRVDFQGPVYLSLDMDVLDPAFAPGVSHHEPGGLSTRDVLTLIQRLQAPLVGADIVEFNPRRDPLGITAMVAAKFLKEIAAHMLER